jgi:hypothetical protein
MKAQSIRSKEHNLMLMREASRIKAYSSIKNTADATSAFIYDDLDGLNAGSVAVLDTMSTNVVGANAIGVQTVTVLSVGTLDVGEEVTYFDDVNLERLVIQAINTGTKAITFATPITKAFKDQARLCRSSLTRDTVNGFLKFNGWSYIATYTNTAVNVIGSALDTNGNGGRKIVFLSNGWWVAAAFSLVAVGTAPANSVVFYKSINGGITWTQLCWQNISSTTNFAICSYGTMVYGICTNTSPSLFAFFYDATTVANTDVSETLIENVTSLGSGVSICADSNGTLHAAWSCKITNFPNSFNIRYGKSTNGGMTWTKQDGTTGFDQITQDNSASITGAQNPCIVVSKLNFPVINWDYTFTSNAYSIGISYSNGTTFSAAVPLYNAGNTYDQHNPCTAVAPNGRIWCVWHGYDATDTAVFNIRYSYSDDGGATWLSAVKLTNGNVYSLAYPTISIDKYNNVYLLWQGQDAASSGWQNIFRNIWTGSAFTGVTKLTTNTTASNGAAASIDNNTMDFGLLTPPTIYKDNQAVAVKFSGTYISNVSIPVLVEDARYNIVPAASITDIVAFVDHDTDANYTLTAAASIHATTETFVPMNKTSSLVDGSTTEDRFVGTMATPGAKGTLRLTASRVSTGVSRNIKLLHGVVQ